MCTMNKSSLFSTFGWTLSLPSRSTIFSLGWYFCSFRVFVIRSSRNVFTSNRASRPYVPGWIISFTITCNKTASLFYVWFIRISATMWRRVFSRISGRTSSDRRNQRPSTMWWTQLFHWQRWAIEDCTTDRRVRPLPSLTTRRPARISSVSHCIFFQRE